MKLPSLFDRRHFIFRIEKTAQWDLIVIGGGASGLGIALDAATRGYSTLLLEGADFAKGTSSRSTKLVHGGVRYLAQGDIRLVMSALRERGRLLKNAPHLVRKQSFVIPCYTALSRLKYLVGLKLYDWLSGKFSFGKSRRLDPAETLQKLPYIKQDKLKGGVEYFDGQFDDARLAVNLAQTIVEQGGVVLNYCKVTGLLKENDKVCGVKALDKETGRQYRLHAKAVVNATGVFVDDVLKMDQPESKPLIRPSQGVHIVVKPAFLESASALMIPETTDGRVLFAVPWHEHVLVGTTDTPIEKHSLEPRPLDREIRFILDTLRQYVQNPPAEKDIVSVFAGLRPLAAPQKDSAATKEISREHKIILSASGLVTVTGGKWTTYRKMAEDTVNKVIGVGKFARMPCKTKQLPVHGCCGPHSSTYLSVYGKDEDNIRLLINLTPSLGTPLVKDMPYTEAEVVWAVKNEMARTIEDVLARRLRLLFLDAGAAISAAPRVAALMAEALDLDAKWQQQQLEEFYSMAAGYQVAHPEKEKPFINNPEMYSMN